MSQKMFAAGLAAIAGLLAFPLSAQDIPVPQPRFQYAAITGSNNTITLTRVPVLLVGGTYAYQDLTLEFSIDTDGNWSLAKSTIVASPELVVSGFKPGNYRPPKAYTDFGEGYISVSGPGVLSSTATAWTVSAVIDKDLKNSIWDKTPYPESATFYVSPLATHPLTARLKKAGITSTAWSYGVGGGANGRSPSAWGYGSILGFSQVGNTITIASFTKYGTSDQSEPVDQITYTLIPAEQ